MYLSAASFPSLVPCCLAEYFSLVIFILMGFTASRFSGYIPQVLNPGIKYAGTSDCSHACENKELKLNFVITFLGFLEKNLTHFRPFCL